MCVCLFVRVCICINAADLYNVFSSMISDVVHSGVINEIIPVFIKLCPHRE